MSLYTSMFAERCHEKERYSSVSAGLPTATITDWAVKTASSIAIGASQMMAMASTGNWPFSLAETLVIPTVPSVAPVQTVNRAGSVVIRDGESALFIAVSSVMQAAVVEFPANLPYGIRCRPVRFIHRHPGWSSGGICRDSGQQNAVNVYICRNNLTSHRT